MEENNKQSKAAIIAVFSVLIIVIIALAGIVFFLLFDKIKEKNQGVSAEKRTEATEFKKKNERKVERETTDEETTEEMKEVENSTLTYDEDIVLDLDGFEFRIPADYGCLISETTGPVVYMSGVFQMKLAVVDTSYDEVMKDPDSLTEKVIEAGGTVTQDVTETELNGKKYAYYQMDLMGDKGLVVYTKAVDEEKRFAGQFVIESDSVTVDDLLHVFEQVTEKATVTDKPNSTDEDLVFPSPAPGEHKEESSLSIKAGTVTFKVPEGFYSEEQADNYNYDDYAMESFYTKNYEVFVDCQLKPVEDWGSGEEYFLFESENKASNGAKVKVESEKIDGVKVYYYVATYDDDGAAYQEIEAVREVGDMIYYVQATAIDWDGELTFDMIRDFMVVK